MRSVLAVTLVAEVGYRRQNYEKHRGERRCQGEASSPRLDIKSKPMTMQTIGNLTTLQAVPVERYCQTVTFTRGLQGLQMKNAWKL